MICSRCNSSIPDGSKFCSVCGAPCGTPENVKPLIAPPESEKKYFCKKCGLELEYGAKFCTVCGAPLGIKDIIPLENDGKTFGTGEMSTVSLNKRLEASDLVAAMPAPASEEAAPAPTPVPTAAAPTAAPAPVPTATAPTTAPGYNSGFSAPTPNAPETPSFAPSGSSYVPAPDYGDINGLNGAAAAAVAVPGKKKRGGKIALIIGIVLVVIIGAAAAFFFTNKATFLSLVMGKPKYAAMVEKNALKKACGELDCENLSNQIKSVSSAIPTLRNMNTSAFMSDRMSDDAQYAQLMSASSSYGMDIKALVKGYGDLMKSTYGAKRITGSMTMNINVNDPLADPNNVLDYINGNKITYDMAATGDLLGGELGFEFNGKPVNIKAILEDDGTMYLAFPFASDKAIKVKIPSESSGRTNDFVLELDPDELERFINECIEIYSDTVKESSASMDKGQLTIAGSVVEGKKLSAEIKGENLANLVNAITDKLANDNYFCATITDYIKNFDPSFTEADYKRALGKKVSASSITGSIIIDTILTRNGDVLAKSYKVVENNKIYFEMAFAGNDEQEVFEIKSDNETALTVKTVKTSETDGKSTITAGIGDGMSIGVNVNYSGLGKATFGKKEIPTGTFAVTLDVSNVDEDYLGGSEAYEALRDMKLDYSIAVENGVSKVDMTLDAGSYGNFSITEEMSLSDDVSPYDAPSNAIDITDMMNNDKYDAQTAQQLQDFSEELMNAIKDVVAGTELEDYLNSGMSGPTSPTAPTTPTTPTTPTNPTNPTGFANASDLSDAIYDEIMEVYNWYSDNNVYSGNAYDNAYEYQNKLLDLWTRVLADIQCDKAKLESYITEYNSLYSQRDALKAAVEKAGRSRA